MTTTLSGADAKNLAFVQASAGCTEAEAQQALRGASGNVDRALELVEHVVQRYLLVGLIIEERGKSAATEGAILALWDRTQAKPIWSAALLTTSAHGAIADWNPVAPPDWARMLHEGGEKLTAYDRKAGQHLADFIRIQSFPIPIEHCFAAPETLPALSRPGPDGEPEHCTRDELLAHHFELLFRGALSFPFTSRVSWFPLSAVARRELAPLMGWPAADPPTRTPVEPEPSEEDTDNPFAGRLVTLRGSLIIDPQAGTTVDDLHPGDRVALQIVDRSPLAQRIGQLLGIRDGTSWSPTWGIVQQVERLDSGSRRITALIAQGVACESVGLGTIRVKRETTAGSATTAGERGSGTPSGALVAGIVIFLGVALVLLLNAGRF